MNGVKIGFLIILISAISTDVQADVIYRPYPPSGLVFSGEVIGSYELPITKLNTINFWGGAGIVAVFEEVRHPAFGTEIAMELRQYFNQNQFRGLNIGLYAGVAYMRYPYFVYGFREYKNSIGIVPGIKLTYKVRFDDLFIFEPYFSISSPIHSSDPENIWNLSTANFGLSFTLGLRIGINIVK